VKFFRQWTQSNRKALPVVKLPYLRHMNQKPPKKWKLLLISWLFVYPVINILFVLIFPLIAELHQLLKTLILTLILVPLMGICIPLLHKKFWNWITQ
jgi:antibiotic biosynthesis monooxygenase (ABM) superfamily enzyme